ncbi:MARVEL domain-containing protein 3 isoform X2 [Oenanthe melanoleuca]|uniref:MARVEL domain-containing protein 3 isoform X2 n=1 Tax=Oenanthe melanoleuca TaxID=2939378 RepID=UPI0024C1D077|nr:MARVEL domain-containing protein 3 isoform X2 [Oenanthe melanoleuca]
MAERGCPRAARGGRAGPDGRAVPGAEAEGPRGSHAVPGSLERRRCLYLRTGRACCQMVEVLLAALILVCSSVSCGSAGGYTGLPALGGIYYYQYGGAYSGFSGAEGELAQQLDQRFYLLKLPIARAAMAVAGCLLVFPCVLILMPFWTGQDRTGQSRAFRVPFSASMLISRARITEKMDQQTPQLTSACSVAGLALLSRDKTA